ncbi:MAG TPA: translation elongation factor Ts [Gammaproteobacteria bacterium]|nr:translation elongation factor Ts [Gammaproteobacteria bacterium]
MSIGAAEVKALRERTGAGMMECKRALTESGGDPERAIEILRTAGLAKADKRAGRTAAQGRIALAGDVRGAAMVEVNSETDFVAAGSDLAGFADAVAAVVLARAPGDLAAVAELPLADGTTVEQSRRALVAKLGENIAVRRVARFATATGIIGRYLHGTRIGVLIELDGGDEELARDVAMHVAASRPVCVSGEEIPADLLAREREIHRAQAEASGKPAAIVEKMVAGRLAKYVNEVTLLGQSFVKDPDRSVAALLEAGGARAVAFARFEVGEGIEKDEADFAAEVMAQVRAR